MGIGSILMNLDFAFNTSNAVKSAAKLKGGMQLLSEVSAVFENKAKIIQKNYEEAFQATYEQIIRNTDVMKGLGVEAESALNAQLTARAGALRSALDDIHTSQLNVLSGMKGINRENALFGAAQATVEAFNRSSEAGKNFSNIFKTIGLSVEDGTDGIITQLTELYSTSEKSFNKLNKVMIEADRLSKGLNPKQLTQYRQHMSQLTDAFNAGSIDANEFAKSQDRLNYRFEVMNERLPKLGQQIGGLFSGVRGQIIGTLGAFAVLDDALSSQQQTVETTHRLALRNIQMFEGQSKSAADFGKTVRDMNASIRSIGGQTQISMTKASEAFNSLAEARIPGTIDDLTNLTVTSVRMSQAFGISEGQAADLFKTLSLAGNLSPAGINEVGEALADVQAVWGLTGAEATEAAAQVGHVINRMSRMGAASIKNAKIVAREVGRMTTAFTRAGLSANEASQMMDRFMDPSKIEENAYLWHTMGLTVSDGLAMMTGDAASMEGMTEKMMMSAVNLKKEYGNNPLALQAMAEAMGMTVQMVNQLSSEYEREANMTSDMRKELERQADLESQAAQARESAAQALQKLAAIGNVFMQTFVMPLLDLITPLITGLGKGLSFINGWLDKLGGLGQAAKAAMGGLLLFTMVSGINLFKLAAPVNGLGGAFAGLLGKTKDLALGGVKWVGQFVAKTLAGLTNGKLSDAFKSIGDKIGKLGTGSTGPAAPATAASAPPAKSSKFMEGMAKLPAKNLMMVGAAVLMVAGAVFLLSLSLKTLVEVIQGATAGEIFGALGIMAILIVGLGLAMFVASKLFTSSAPGLLIFGGAMLMVAAAVAIMVLSLSVLLNTIKDMDPATIAMGIGILAVALIGLIVAAAVMAPMAITAGTGLLFLGGALLMIGGAVALMVLSVALLLNTIKDMDAGQIALGILTLAVALGGLIGMAAIMAPVAATAGAGLISFGFALLMVGGAVVLIGAGFLLMSIALKSLVESVNNLGPAFTANATAIAKGALAISLPLLGLAVVATIAFLPLAALGIAFLALGAGAAALGAGLNLIATAFNTFIEMGNQIIPVSLKIMSAMILLSIGLLAVAGVGYLFNFAILGLLAIIPGLILLGMAMGVVSNSFMNMGNGVKLFAENIGIVLTGIDQLKQKLSGISGMSNTFVEEVGKMTEALSELKSFAGAGIINGMITMLMKPAKGSADKDTDNTSAMTETMNQMVGHLEDISSYTSRTALAVEKIVDKMSNPSVFDTKPRVNLA